MSRPLLTLMLAALVLLAPLAARAAGGNVEFDDRPFNLQMRLGMGSSVGVLGVVGEFDLADRFNVGAGVGTNLRGPIVGAHGRVRPVIFRNDRGTAANAIVIEGAVSRSRYAGGLEGITTAMCEGDASQPSSNCYNPHIEEEYVWWGQIELGWELRLKTGFLARTTFGGAWLLATPDWQCTLNGAPAPCGRHFPATAQPTTTIAVGYAF